MKPKHLSPERHRQIGHNLLRSREELIALIGELGRAYSVNGPEVRAAQAALRAVDKLRLQMDDRLFKEHGGGVGGSTPELGTLYFGGQNPVNPHA